MLGIKRLFFIYNDMRQKIIKSLVNKLAFFSCCPLPHLFSQSAFQAGGDAHGRGGDAHGGEGECTCILCIPPRYAPDRQIYKPYYHQKIIIKNVKSDEMTKSYSFKKSKSDEIISFTFPFIDIGNRKTTPPLRELATPRLGNSQTRRVGNSQTLRLLDSATPRILQFGESGSR